MSVRSPQFARPTAANRPSGVGRVDIQMRYRRRVDFGAWAKRTSVVFGQRIAECSARHSECGARLAGKCISKVFVAAGMCIEGVDGQQWRRTTAKSSGS